MGGEKSQRKENALSAVYDRIGRVAPERGESVQNLLKSGLPADPDLYSFQ
jgi:hypothetical protein